MAFHRRKKSGNSILRAVFVALSFLLQLGWILLLILKLNQYSTYLALVTNFLAALAVLKLYSNANNTAYKMPWIMLIMAMPIMGLSLYLITQAAVSTRSIRKRMEAVREDIRPQLPEDSRLRENLKSTDPGAANVLGYVSRFCGGKAYVSTATRYYGETLDALRDLKADLEQAERFIFMEYFILEDGESFCQIREVLERKAAQGVEVRLMYDDVGSIGKTNWRYAAGMNKKGIHCRPFNPALPFLNLFLNHRDHRKITVIDGKVGYTGGYNLADEYFHYSKPYGDWKDTGIRLEGEGVRGLTATFLELWNLNAGTRENCEPYLNICHRVPGRGLVQPFGDDPLTGERAAENVYLNLIHHAKTYVWFMTPYLIITDELSSALELAAKRGVDVRIITPGIPDKKTVYAVTRSYYPRLTDQGVRIFEYSPGFCHGKMCLCDGELACIGTSNLDYRSLYLHFENNVLLYGCEAVGQMEQDFREMFPMCREVTTQSRSLSLRIWQCVLRLFAPML